MHYWERRLRLATGLVLASYIVVHFVNHAVGIAGMEAIAAHVIGTRVAAEVAGFDPDYYYVVTVVAAKPRVSVQMALLMTVVWTHVVIGLHFWLRLKDWYRASFPLWVFVAIAVPVLAGAGILRAVLTAREWLGDSEALSYIFEKYNDLDAADRQWLSALETPVLWTLAGLLLAVLAARRLRAALGHRRASLRIEHANGRSVPVRRGQTLLEAIRQSGIPHASVCGGRARCTTCRVRVGVGRELLPEPSPLERDALTRIGADDNVRLACQTRPVADLAITPLVAADCDTGTALSVGGVQGTEREVVCMFVDMRGSTRMGEQILPYDVVFILNQFFVQLSDALEATGGHYAQFAGDGLMALYGLDHDDMGRAVGESLDGAAEMFRRVRRLNDRLRPEFGREIRMGIGIHAGPAIVGRMGPPRAPILSAIGDNINIAARLESATKTEGCDLIVSREALDYAPGRLSVAALRTLSIRGREKGIEVAMLLAEELLAHPGT